MEKRDYAGGVYAFLVHSTPMVVKPIYFFTIEVFGVLMFHHLRPN